MSLDLSDITLCAADSVNTALTAHALQRCMSLCRFGAALLFTDADVAGPFRTVKIASLRTKADYSAFMLRELPMHVATPFALVVQWDGYVLDPRAWRAEFRAYDYIGARWPWHTDGLTVGNGGFSLRSKKLLAALADPQFQAVADAPEDNLICRVNRALLESKHGLRFAPESVADQFAYERAPPAGATFGFHGLFNVWRHMSEDEIAALAAELGGHAVGAREFLELTLACFELRRHTALRALYGRLRGLSTAAELERAIIALTGSPPLARACVQAGEDLCR